MPGKNDTRKKMPRKKKKYARQSVLINLYEGSIPPPPGYEGADMKAPKDWEADDRFIPVTTEPRPAQGTLPPKYQAMDDKKMPGN